MKKLAIVCIALCAGAIALTISPVKSSGKNDKFFKTGRAIPNRYIVVLNDNIDPASNFVSVGDLSRKYPGRVDKVFTYALNGYAVEMSEDEALKLSDDPRVKYVEEDAEIVAQETQTDATWGISRIDQRSFASPIDTNYNYQATGAGVNVYVVDTGVLVTHPDFGGRAVDAFDAYNENIDISQCNGHGTHVAGTIGSNTYGVAKNVTLYSVKVFPCYGNSSSASVIAGIDWINRNASPPAVVNMSLAGTASSTLDQAVKNSINQGFTYVVAAGNYSTDACGYSPADVAGAITVGATHTSDSRDETTNYGRCVDVFAPGVAIKSTWNQYPLPYPTFIMAGTSTASPHVAGVAALYLQNHPTASPSEVSRAIVSNATPGAVYNPGTGSPNLLLFSQFDSGPPPAGCAGTGFTGSLPGSGSVDFQSSSAGFPGRSGRYSGTLRVPAGAAFSLGLEKKVKIRWSTVASSSGGPTDQTINYNGKTGTYRWTITSALGSGSYSLCTENP